MCWAGWRLGRSISWLTGSTGRRRFAEGLLSVDGGVRYADVKGRFDEAPLVVSLVEADDVDELVRVFHAVSTRGARPRLVDVLLVQSDEKYRMIHDFAAGLKTPHVDPAISRSHFSIIGDSICTSLRLGLSI